MIQAAILGRVREFFTLRETERATHALPDDARASVLRELALASQRREAAETLWPHGSAAEALGLLGRSLEGIAAALEDLASRLDGPTTPDAPSAPQVQKPWLARSLAIVAEARRQTADFKRPELEPEVDEGCEVTFQLLVDALVGVEEAIGPQVATSEQIALLRRKRIVTASLGAVACIVALAFALRTRGFSHAEASAALGEHVAEHAIDGDTKTWWVLPPDQQGWLDLTLTKARAVPELRIIGGNPPGNDHLTRDAHIEAFLGALLVKATDVTFRIPPSAEPDWTEVKLDAPKCDRIRITPRGAWRGTGTIGEVEAP